MEPHTECEHSTENSLRIFKALKGSDREVKRQYGKLGRGAPGGPAVEKKCQAVYDTIWKKFLKESNAFDPALPRCEGCWSSIIAVLAGFHCSAFNAAKALALRVPNNLSDALRPHYEYFVGMFSKAGCERGGRCIGPGLYDISRYFHELYLLGRLFPFIHTPSAAINLSQPVVDMDMYLREKAELVTYPIRPTLAWRLFILCVLKRILRGDFFNHCNRTELHNLSQNLSRIEQLCTTDLALLYCIDDEVIFMDAGGSLLHYRRPL